MSKPEVSVSQINIIAKNYDATLRFYRMVAPEPRCIGMFLNLLLGPGRGSDVLLIAAPGLIRTLSRPELYVIY